MPTTVIVVTAPGHPTLLQSDYVVRHVADYWTKRGVRFELVTSPRTAPPGDIAWQHLDVTEVDSDYRHLLEQYPRTINGNALSFAKRGTATHLVVRDDDWKGAVIVKTDQNFGGHGEDWAHQRRWLRHPKLHALRDQLPVRLSGRMDPAAYPIHSSKSEVPRWVWNDSRFVVQRFLGEVSGQQYAVRRWFFFGDCEFAYLAHAREPIVMGDYHLEWEELVRVPEALRELRHRIRLDFGKIDYAEVAGEVVVYDVNPAVSADGPKGSVLQRRMVDTLVPGLATFLDVPGG